MKKDKDKPTVIIIGAGIAGLAAAKVLSQANINTKILEARNRYGGRIWIDHSMNVPLGKGASWIHGKEKSPFNFYIKKYNLSYFSFDEKKCYTYDVDKKRISQNRINHYNTKFDKTLAKSTEFAHLSSHDISLRESLSPMLLKEKLVSENELFNNKLRHFENYVGAEYEYLSARYWNEDPIDGEQGLLADSYEKIISELARNTDLEFNTIVQAIHRTPNKVEIVTNHNLHFADAVLITVPLGVLKKNTIHFSPPLSSEKQDSIKKLAMGTFNIIGMQFKKMFWPEDAQAFCLPYAPVCSMFLNMQRIHHSPILLGYFGGVHGDELEKQTDEYLIKRTIDHLRYFFGRHVSSPTRYFITRWQHDPFSYGSYSYLPLGASPQDRDLLEKSETDQLFFAGEATMKKSPATAHGAYLSGIKQARNIIKTLL